MISVESTLLCEERKGRARSLRVSFTVFHRERRAYDGFDNNVDLLLCFTLSPFGLAFSVISSSFAFLPLFPLSLTFCKLFDLARQPR